MRKIECSIETSVIDGDRHAIIEVDDNATDEEIDEAVREWALNYVSWGWRDAPTDGK